jgi:hypothetical protein
MNNELVQQAHKGLVIQDIFLHSGEIKTKDDFCPLAEEVPFEIQFKHFVKDSRILSGKNADHEQIDLILFRYVAGFRALPKGLLSEDEKESNTVVEVIATFSACYTMIEELPDEATAEFAKYNVGFNVWPYWREYATSTAKRLGLPSFAIPLYRLPI